MSIRGVGSAPVSFGVYGSLDELQVSPMDLLDAVAEAGYSAMELGPPGFFGSPEATVGAFADRGLSAVGAYVAIHLGGDDADVERDLAGMRQSLAELAQFPTPGLVILADEGAPELLLDPARDWDDRRLALDDRGWSVLADRMAAALELAEAAGITTSFHPHIGTYIESPWEVERLLASTDIKLTLDTGHFWLAGADPTEYLARFGERVNHVHLKDVRRSVLRQAKAQGRTDFDTWWGDVATPLGDGDIDLAAFIQELHRGGYDGWITIEQDRRPLGHDPIEPAIAEQTQNRRWAEAVLVTLPATGAQDEEPA
jgi:inosose dehydratase